MLILNEPLGKRIVHYRKVRKLSQVELTAITGLRSRHICDTEKGRRIRIHTLALLAAALGVTIEELVGIR